MVEFFRRPDEPSNRMAELYIDNRPLLNPAHPELRQYKAIFVIGNDEIGLESDVAEGVCKP